MRTRIEITLYNIYLDVHCAGSTKEAKKIHQKLLSKMGRNLGSSDLDAKAIAYRLYSDKKGYCIQAVLLDNFWDCTVSEYSHEALHCVFNIMRYVGIDYCPKSEEAFAYLQGFITEAIADANEAFKESHKK